MVETSVIFPVYCKYLIIRQAQIDSAKQGKHFLCLSDSITTCSHVILFELGSAWSLWFVMLPESG